MRGFAVGAAAVGGSKDMAERAELAECVVFCSPVAARCGGVAYLG
ncbi:MAG TPA: hypothetical protein VMD08_17960 [Candidatus Baltobacteraceae bacterium]|nr:hypothetical protein [Candidatus Baltobacteraceae bacterium]